MEGSLISDLCGSTCNGSWDICYILLAFCSCLMTCGISGGQRDVPTERGEPKGRGR